MLSHDRTTVLGASSEPNVPDSTVPSQLSILYFNARSILLKISELQAVCLASNPDIVCITETWLSPEIGDLEVTIPDYSCIRLDRNRHG